MEWFYKILVCNAFLQYFSGRRRVVGVCADDTGGRNHCQDHHDNNHYHTLRHDPDNKIMIIIIIALSLMIMMI